MVEQNIAMAGMTPLTFDKSIDIIYFI